MYTVAVDCAVDPARFAVVEVPPPLKLMVTGEPTGMLVPWTRTGIGSCNWVGSIKSIELKLPPEYEGTGYPPMLRIVIEGGLVGTISGLTVAITGTVPEPV